MASPVAPGSMIFSGEGRRVREAWVRATQLSDYIDEKRLEIGGLSCFRELKFPRRRKMPEPDQMPAQY
jgi:hypothetical protein